MVNHKVPFDREHAKIPKGLEKVNHSGKEVVKEDHFLAPDLEHYSSQHVPNQTTNKVGIRGLMPNKIEPGVSVPNSELLRWCNVSMT